MQATITAVRAIGAEYAKRMLLPPIIVGAIFVIALLTLGGWLTTQSAWWWILEALFIIGAMIFTLLVSIVCVVINFIAPKLSKAEKKSVRHFVDKLERVGENIGTPQVVIAYRVVRDTIVPSREGFIETVSRDSKTLAPDFLKLRKMLDRS